MKSLSARIALSAGLVLLVFMVLTVIALDQAFHDSARSALQERLLSQIFLLMAAAEVDAKGRLSMPEPVPETRFSLPGSGLYAQITDGAGRTVWRSRSTLGTQVELTTTLAPGEHSVEERSDTDKRGYLITSYGITWANEGGRYRFTFTVSEELSALAAQINQYRRTLWAWLAAMAILLLLTQAVVLRWGLRPLRRVAGELSAIKAGRQERIQENYPHELSGLTDSLNDLLRHERAQQKRYRDALSDLAHSLKTPLAVLRGALAEGKKKQIAADSVDEQVGRMDQIVRYQLQRAATAGRMSLAAPVPLRTVVSKLIDSLSKVHGDKDVDISLELEDNVAFRGDEGDLMELLGNTLDNAYKWCRKRVRIRARESAGRLTIEVEDDGPGVGADDMDEVLQRGARADERVPGHGIGLAIVRDIMRAYNGDIELSTSALGGTEVRLVLPQG
ncbi:MAG: ATP-binding protein [Acidiferrobacterales bacterium]